MIALWTRPTTTALLAVCAGKGVTAISAAQAPTSAQVRRREKQRKLCSQRRKSPRQRLSGGVIIENQGGVKCSCRTTHAEWFVSYETIELCSKIHEIFVNYFPDQNPANRVPDRRLLRLSTQAKPNNTPGAETSFHAAAHCGGESLARQFTRGILKRLARTERSDPCIAPTARSRTKKASKPTQRCGRNLPFESLEGDGIDGRRFPTHRSRHLPFQGVTGSDEITDSLSYFMKIYHPISFFPRWAEHGLPWQ